MLVALDTNVVLALMRDDADDAVTISATLDTVSSQGALMICPPVYAELLAAPGRDRAFIDRFLEDTAIYVDWLLSRQVWESAAMAYRAYGERRRAQAGDVGPRRILTDFVIGAHALHHAASLLTFDQGIYRAAFPALQVVVPAV